MWLTGLFGGSIKHYFVMSNISNYSNYAQFDDGKFVL